MWGGTDLQPLFDESWRKAALAGQPEAIDRLARASLAPLFRFCLYRVGGNRDLCEEVVQETLCRAIRGLEKYEPARADGDPFPWLMGLARNEIHRVLAREKSATSLEALWTQMDEELLALYARLDSEAFDEDTLRRDETRQMVNATMSQLPPHYREALEAKYVAGRSVREMAAARQVSEKTIESQLSRARKAFRATFLALTRGLAAEAI